MGTEGKMNHGLAMLRQRSSPPIATHRHVAQIAADAEPHLIGRGCVAATGHSRHR
ncbi:MAG: hypothetical protein ACJAVR_000816 [Paracoccaceae bacterium]|jgi:hypothetical protein